MTTYEDSARLFERGIEAYRTRCFSEAVELLERVRSNSPGETKILSYLAESFRYLRRHDDAERMLDELVELQPDDPWFWFRRGRARYAQGKYDEAIADLDEAERLEEDSVFDQGLNELFLIRADCWEALGEIDKAISSIKMYGFAYGFRYVVEREVARLEALAKGSR